MREVSRQVSRTSYKGFQSGRHSHYVLHGIGKLLFVIFDLRVPFDVLSTPPFTQNPQMMQPTTIYVKLVASILSKYKLYKSRGPGGLHPRLLRLVIPVIFKPLARFFRFAVLKESPSQLEKSGCNTNSLERSKNRHHKLPLDKSYFNHQQDTTACHI